MAEPREAVRAIRISVRYFDQTFYGGWHCYVDSPVHSEWVRGDHRTTAQTLMRVFPLAATWESWKQQFAITYSRGTQDNKPHGAVFCLARLRLERVEDIITSSIIKAPHL
ncbi:MAG TPA: hypothetical protein VGH19_06790 [Verrucomicrobiae bacterium]